MSKKHKIAIMTDSVCSIPPDLIEQYNIYVVPTRIIWGTEDLIDGVDITPADFYERLARDPIHPKTSQAILSEFVAFYEKAKKDGAAEVLCITVSNQLSGTLLSATQAREQVKFPVHILDSYSAAMGQGWQILAAARVREAGGDAHAMMAAAEKVRAAMAVYLTVETLDYLHKGGRIGGAARLIGTMLSIKPLLYVDHTVGRIERAATARTRKKAIEAMYDAFMSKMDSSKPLRIAVQHAAAMDEARQLLARIKADHKTAEVLLCEVPAVIGVHVGPGALALCGYSES